MNLYKYYSNAFPIPSELRSLRPEESKIGYNNNQMCRIIDFLFMEIDSNISGKNFPIKYMLRQPSNIFLMEKDDMLMIGISFGKAIFRHNTFMWLNKYASSLSDSSLLGFGNKIDFTISISIKDLLSYSERWNLLFSISDFIIAPNRLQGFGIQKFFKEYSKDNNIDKSEYEDKFKNENNKDEEFNSFINKICVDFEKQVERKYNIMNINPKFSAKDMVVKNNQGFYVLPFQDDTTDVLETIQDELSDRNINCNLIKSEDRFDPSRGNNIIENIWQDICSSRFVIADLSQKNPNVYYELGICDTLGKKVIPICSKKSFDEDYNKHLPTDIEQEYTLFYDKNNLREFKKFENDIIQRIQTVID